MIRNRRNKGGKKVSKEDRGDLMECRELDVRRSTLFSLLPSPLFRFSLPSPFTDPVVFQSFCILHPFSLNRERRAERIGKGNREKR